VRTINSRVVDAEGIAHDRGREPALRPEREALEPDPVGGLSDARLEPLLRLPARRLRGYQSEDHELVVHEGERVEAARALVVILEQEARGADPARRALAQAAERAGLGTHEVVCFAGHDAEVIAERRPAGMVLVRNAGGVSRAPGEDVELEDPAAAARVVAAVEALV
jgi:hypothetical protein